MRNNWTSRGLSDDEVAVSRKKYGSNEIILSRNKSFINLLLDSLGDPIIKILLIALAIKVLLLFQDSNWFETIGIVIAIFLASFISTISEYGSEKAFKKLQEETSKLKAKVKRNNHIIELSIDDIVKNDIVLLSSGDKIPADGHLIKGNVDVDESIITGEAKEQTKREKEKLFRGTTIYSGEGLMIVDEVGNNTFYGDIANKIQDKCIDSPLKTRLRELAKIISKIGYIGAVLVVFSYLFSVIVIANNYEMPLIISTLTNTKLMIGHMLYALTLSVTIIIVSVPEGLPMMISLVLSSNMKKMLKSNVLVRKMVGIETAGSLNLLLTDKTGTLTKGKLEVIGIVNYSNDVAKTKQELKKFNKLEELITTSITYNNSGNYLDNKVIGGNITDQALLYFIKEKKVKDIKDFLPFNSEKKFSIVSINNNNYIKGAPDVLLKNCNYYYDNFGRKKELDAKYLRSIIDNYTMKGNRVLLLAIKDNPLNIIDINNLIFVCLVLIKDDIRENAILGVNTITNSGINIMMVTGDAKMTAKAIAIETNIINNVNDLILDSDELKKYDDNSLKEIFLNIKVIARALPSDKLRLVNIAQEMGLVVGMTGDGVNDAPALKKADVGFSMGSGTEVAKEASDIVILDDNILSISNAILYGRTTYKSIRKFIIYQLTCNMCALVLSIIGPFIGINTPITIIQMLWINMIMDTFAGLAFSFEPPLDEYMKEPPKKKDEPIMNKYMYSEIIITGSYSALICLLFLKIPHSFIRYDLNNKYLMTAYFALFIFIGIANAFNSRTTRINILANIKKNITFILIFGFILTVQIYLIYYGSDMFRTYGLNLKELIVTGLIAISVIPVDMLRKKLIKTKSV